MKAYMKDYEGPDNATELIGVTEHDSFSAAEAGEFFWYRRSGWEFGSEFEVTLIDDAGRETTWVITVEPVPVFSGRRKVAE